MSVEQILADVLTFPTRHVVLTGGEPMIAPGLAELAAALRGEGRHLTIETAATISPDGIACDLASLSPKLANSTPTGLENAAWTRKHDALRRQPDVIAAWMAHCDYQLKFVVSSESDILEVHQLLAELPLSPPPHKILLMPEGRTVAELAMRSAWLVEICKKYGHRYCHRLHIDLFGNRRGT